MLNKRKNLRLRDYDYAQGGYYYITICTNKRECILCRGKQCLPEENGRFLLSRIGVIVEKAMNQISIVYPNVSIDHYVIMPNHIHMIIIFSDSVEQIAPTISRVIKQMKGYVTKQLGHSIWQKSFYEHIIRNEQDYLEIWRYIDNNPAKWQEDKYYLG